MNWHQHKEIENDEQKDALFNEYKGNLFEYLVALELSKKLNLEQKFLKNLSSDLLSKLKSYQQSLFAYDPDLYKKLPFLAIDFTNHFFSKTLSSNDLVLLKGFDEIFVLGKLQASAKDKLWQEADIVFRSSKDKSDLGISLKLSKTGSYTNTKSAGIKSFFLNYFENFKNTFDLILIQNNFNLYIDQSFLQMNLQMYQEAGLSYEDGFGVEWTNDYPELPGLLPPVFHEILMNHYQRLALELLRYLIDFYQADLKAFKKSIINLMGHEGSDLWQLICFHQDHQFHDLSFLKLADTYKKLLDSDCKLNEQVYGSGNINIEIDQYLLQLRVKPMNKFTSKAYKINCSVKEKNSLK